MRTVGERDQFATVIYKFNVGMHPNVFCKLNKTLGSYVPYTNKNKTKNTTKTLIPTTPKNLV